MWRAGAVGTFELGDLRVFDVLQLLDALLVLVQGPAVVIPLHLVLLVQLVVLLLQVLVLVLQPQCTSSSPTPQINQSINQSINQPIYNSMKFFSLCFLFEGFGLRTHHLG